MGKKDAKTVLWENVSSLMTHEFGRENMTRFANKCGFAVSTVQRIKEMKTSVGIDVVEQIADAFKIDVWQVMVPNLNPALLPTLDSDRGGWPMTMFDKSRFTNLPLENRLFIQGYLLRTIEDQEAILSHRGNGTSN